MYVLTSETPDAATWAHYPHDADIGVRGYGKDPPEAFANAARAMIAAITPLEKIRCRKSVAIECTSGDIELLFFDWMNAVIFEMATRRMIFGDFKVRIHGTRLSAEALGEPIDVRRHAPAVEPKGATLTGLSLARGEDGCWTAECVVDV